MKFLENYPDAINQIKFIKLNDPDLFQEALQNHTKSLNLAQKKLGARGFIRTEGSKAEALQVDKIEDEGGVLPFEQAPMDETIVLKDMRPVFTIRDNKIAFDNGDSDSTIWKNRLAEKEEILNSLLNRVGRIEVNSNAVYNWVGTGWLIDQDIIVTNRHVASIFSVNAEGFKFKIGYPSGLQSSKIDFLEEDQRTTSFEFDIDYVLWMSENIEEEPDVAFLRVKQNNRSKLLPNPIELGEPEGEGEVVVTVGYPARDPRIPDQELVLKIFGDIYEKKRLAPGLITKYDKSTIQHDCSTLGGESGGVVISLRSGKAIGLHYGGLFMKGNFAVSAIVLKSLLQKLKTSTLPRMNLIQSKSTNPIMENIANSDQINSNKISIDLNIPVKLTFEIGAVSVLNGTTLPAAIVVNRGISDENLSFSQALNQARKSLLGKSGVMDVYGGYRFKNGWITDEQVIVVDVQQKLTLPQLRGEDLKSIPREFGRFGTDVRTGAINDQIDFLGISLPEREAVPKAGAYREPPGLKLAKVRAQMKAIFHVSPDSGFPNLKAFFERIEKRLTATIYEWEAAHISDSLYHAISSNDGHLKMVTQKPGTKEAVEQMKSKLGDKFDHVWASVGAGKIVPTAYHIKVASRDEKEFWLSSGNWKDSNQADINPAGENETRITPLREHNREWNVIIENDNLAKLFQNFIEWDFQEAQRIPLEEAIESEVYLLIPESQDVLSESRPIAKYFKPLIVDKVLDVQPLLTPDHTDSGQRMFIKMVTDLISNAKKTIDIQNQSFSLLEENDEEYERFFNTLLQKQNEGIGIRIIFRDPTEFSRTKGEENLKKQLDRLKAFGLDTDNMKVQKKCHNKAIIIDSDDNQNATVLFGSHNLTTSGALFNRDASLIIRDKEVAQYFQQIFDFDWDVLAVQRIEESVGAVQLTTKEAVVPIGYKKITLSQLLSAD